MPFFFGLSGGSMKIGIRYYLYFLPSLVIFFIASALLHFSTEEYICFFTAISFAGLYCHPNRDEYFEGRTSRFNFANAVMNFYTILEDRIPDNTWGNVVLRHLPGFLFFLLVGLVGISTQARIVYIVGVLLFEVTFYFFIKNNSPQIDLDEHEIHECSGHEENGHE